MVRLSGHTKRIMIMGLISFLGMMTCRATRAEPVVLGIRYWSSPSSTRIVLDLSGEFEFTTFALPGPPRVVIDLSDVSVPKSRQTIPVGSALVDQIRLARHSPRVVRIVLDLKKPGLSHNAFGLPPMYGRSFRLVIDVESLKIAREMREARHAVQSEKVGGAYVVVVDPGHGGEDPGAIGPGKTQEKHVALAIARMIQKRLNQRPGVRTFLTRTGDYYVGLRQRVGIAQDYGADLFLSIHADASPSRKPIGASVYCLSTKGATDEAARILAERENAADFLGGIRLNDDDTLNAILIDLVQTQTINDSLKFGESVLKEFRKVRRLRYSTPRQAGFEVLKAPEIPSALVEVGFISNPKEERILRSSSRQDLIAGSLENSIRRFLCQQESAPESQLASDFCQSSDYKVHVVKPGQSLSKIASLYRTTIREIQQINKIRDTSRIYPGQKLLIPY
ncbi:MAG: AMIN domain-containing protein [Proteobacteria bacterium]|nr:AMIN domain-containing protein [Pseudomonadota bacterium]